MVKKLSLLPMLVGLIVFSVLLAPFASANSGLSNDSSKNLTELNDLLEENLEMLMSETFQVNFDTRIKSIERKREANIAIPQTILTTGKAQKIFIKYVNDTLTYADNSRTPTHSLDETGVMMVSLNHVLDIGDFSAREIRRIRSDAKQKSGDSNVLLMYDTANLEYPYLSQLFLGSVFVLDTALPQSVVIENAKNAKVVAAKQKNGSMRFTVTEEPVRTKINNTDVFKTTKIFTFNKNGFLTNYRYLANNNIYLSSSRIVFKTTVLDLEGDVYLPDELGIFPKDDEI